MLLFWTNCINTFSLKTFDRQSCDRALVQSCEHTSVTYIINDRSPSTVAAVFFATFDFSLWLRRWCVQCQVQPRGAGKNLTSKMYIKLFLISLLSLSIADEIKRENNVLVLTKDNFEDAVKNKNVLVEFCKYTIYEQKFPCHFFCLNFIVCLIVPVLMIKCDNAINI